MADKVAIVGSASSSANKAPYDDPDYEIWVLAWRPHQRVDAAFDMHSIDESRQRVPKDYLKYLRAWECPVYTLEKLPEVPNTVRYPIEEVSAFLESFDPNAEGKYFASSVAYMFAFAMYHGYEQIDIYGVDLVCDEEYVHQRPNTEYMIGLARGMGIKVHIPETSALLKHTHIYGYENPESEGIINKENLRERIAEYQKKKDKSYQVWCTCDGAIQEAEQLLELIEHHERGSQRLNYGKVGNEIG